MFIFTKFHLFGFDETYLLVRLFCFMIAVNLVVEIVDFGAGLYKYERRKYLGQLIVRSTLLLPLPIIFFEPRILIYFIYMI